MSQSDLRGWIAAQSRRIHVIVCVHSAGLRHKREFAVLIASPL